MLVVDGSCVNNGAGAGRNPPAEEGNAPKGGLSFIYNGGNAGGHGTTMPYITADNMSTAGAPPWGDQTISIPDITGRIAMPLEQKGPCGDIHRHTSNRAKLRAVIAALDFRPWYGEGWQTVVIVTDLEYVVLGATRWLPAWVQRRWRLAPRRDSRGRLRPGRKLANRDLWEELQSRIEDLRANGTEVAFWLIPPRSLIREDSNLLREAKSAAREAARSSGAVVDDYTRLCGLFV
jgi:ribonuclease HI